LLRKTDRQSERLERQKEKRETLREVREEEYWSVEKVTDGSAFAYERQQVREEGEHKSNGNRRGGGRKRREQKAEGLAATGMQEQAKNGITYRGQPSAGPCARSLLNPSEKLTTRRLHARSRKGTSGFRL
jgi:hypothetical protein